MMTRPLSSRLVDVVSDHDLFDEEVDDFLSGPDRDRGDAFRDCVRLAGEERQLVGRSTGAIHRNDPLGLFAFPLVNLEEMRYFDHRACSTANDDDRVKQFGEDRRLITPRTFTDERMNAHRKIEHLWR